MEKQQVTEKKNQIFLTELNEYRNVIMYIHVNYSV